MAKAPYPLTEEQNQRRIASFHEHEAAVRLAFHHGAIDRELLRDCWSQVCAIRMRNGDDEGAKRAARAWMGLGYADQIDCRWSMSRW